MPACRRCWAGMARWRTSPRRRSRRSSMTYWQEPPGCCRRSGGGAARPARRGGEHYGGGSPAPRLASVAGMNWATGGAGRSWAGRCGVREMMPATHGQKEFLDKKSEGRFRWPRMRCSWGGGANCRRRAAGVAGGGEYAGVLLHGMGRLGKSSLAARIANRRRDLRLAVALPVLWGTGCAGRAGRGVEGQSGGARGVAGWHHCGSPEIPIGGLEDVL